MKLKNISHTIIGIGTRILLPGDEMEATGNIASLPAVTLMVDRGELALDDTEERIAAAAAAAKKEAEAENANKAPEPENVPEKAPASGRKKAAEKK